MVECEDTQALHGECAKLGEDSEGIEVATGVPAHAAPCAERANAAPGRRRPQEAGGWYVIQVPTGKEAALCAVIERVAEPGELSECFVPSFETQRKVRGAWETVRAVLFPGYVVAVTRDVGALKQRLRGVSEFTRLLTMGESFVPLDDADRAWLSAFTTADDRAIPMSMGVVEGDRIVVTQGPLMGGESFVPLDDADRAWLSAFTTADDRAIPMSMGVVEGDRIVVTQGPLMGHEGWITSVNRRKSLAFIQVEMFGRKIETRIGLGIVRRKPCPNSNVNQEKSESAS